MFSYAFLFLFINRKYRLRKISASQEIQAWGNISNSGYTDLEQYPLLREDIPPLLKEYALGKIWVTHGIQIWEKYQQQTWKNISYSGNTDLGKYHYLIKFRLVEISVTQEIPPCKVSGTRRILTVKMPNHGHSWLRKMFIDCKFALKLCL